MGGIRPKGLRRIQFDFEIDGVRFRPTLPWIPTPANLEQAQKLNARIKAQIEAGTFVFSDVFPKFKGLRKLPGSVSAKSCGEVFDDFLRHEQARVARDDLAPVTLKSHRQILDQVWRPALGRLPFQAVQYSMMVKVADSHCWNKKTYNNAISALRRAFAFGYLDYPDRVDPATRLRSAKMGKKDRPRIDPFSIQDAEVFIAALHQDWGEAHGNYEEFRFFTGLRPSEEIALTVSGLRPSQRRSQCHQGACRRYRQRLHQNRRGSSDPTVPASSSDPRATIAGANPTDGATRNPIRAASVRNR
jgi:integrase